MPVNQPIALALTLVSAPALAQDVMLIPDSAGDRVWAFSAADGSFITDGFITDPGAPDGVDVFSRPIEIVESASGTFLISDQFADVVSEFAADGSFVRVFSLGGVRDTTLMDNIRGLAVLSSGPSAGDAVVCNAGNTNPLTVSQDNVKRLAEADGAEQPDFAFNRYGGIRGPFDALEYNGEILVSTDTQNAVVRLTPDGTFNERFTSRFDVPALDFPQQMAEAGNGNLLVCAFSGGAILEFNPAGTLVGQYDPGTLSLYRGVAELDNGNLLVTTTTGVHEVTRAGLVIETEAAGTDFRYITRHTPAVPPAPARHAPPTEPVIDTRTRAEILADERGEPRPATPTSAAREEIE